jgi:hypothetical protein
MAIFVFFGSAFYLYIKARQGPGPYIFPCVFGCICLGTSSLYFHIFPQECSHPCTHIDITLTTAALFPYPYYLVGRSISVPITMHSAIALLASIFFFPSSISAMFTTRLSEVLSPMLANLKMHRTLLSDTLSSPSFPANLTAMRSETKKVEAALIPVAAAARLLKSDLIYGRYSPDDFRTFQALFRRMAGRADGLAVYFGLVDPARERFLGTANPTPAGTAPGTPRRGLSRATSRAPSVERESDGRHGDSDGEKASPTSPSRIVGSTSLPNTNRPRSTTSADPRTPPKSVTHSRSHSHFHLHNPLSRVLSGPSQPHHHPHHHHHHHLLHSSLLSLARAKAKKPEYAVGTFESQRYLNLEMTRLHDPNEEEYTERTVELLKERFVHSVFYLHFCTSSRLDQY